MNKMVELNWIRSKNKRPSQTGSYLICYKDSGVRWRVAYWDNKNWLDNSCSHSLFEPDWWAEVELSDEIKITRNLTQINYR